MSPEKAGETGGGIESGPEQGVSARVPVLQRFVFNGEIDTVDGVQVAIIELQNGEAKYPGKYTVSDLNRLIVRAEQASESASALVTACVSSGSEIPLGYIVRQANAQNNLSALQMALDTLNLLRP